MADFPIYSKPGADAKFATKAELSGVNGRFLIEDAGVYPARIDAEPHVFVGATDPGAAMLIGDSWIATGTGTSSVVLVSDLTDASSTPRVTLDSLYQAKGTGGASAVTTLTVPAGQLAPVVGTPALGLIARTAVYLLDGAATEIVGGMVVLPAVWATMHVDLLWANTTTGTGNVKLRFDYSSVTVGSPAPDPATGTNTVAATTGNTNVTQTRVATGVGAPDGLIAFEVIRLGGEPEDTHTADIGVVGVVFTQAT